MRTASFFTYDGPGRVSIARYAPRGTAKGFRIYRKLAPGEWFNKVTKERYVELFTKDVLDVLDPKQAWGELHELAGDAEPVLLCWERPPFSDKNWCHRRMVARWFEERLGLIVPELEPAGAQEQLLK